MSTTDITLAKVHYRGQNKMIVLSDANLKKSLAAFRLQAFAVFGLNVQNCNPNHHTFLYQDQDLDWIQVVSDYDLSAAFLVQTAMNRRSLKLTMYQSEGAPEAQPSGALKEASHSKKSACTIND